MQVFVMYLAVVEDFVDGFRNKENFPTITTNHKQETISSLHQKNTGIKMRIFKIKQIKI